MKKKDQENTCEICGNEYDKLFEVVIEGTSHFFDSFECAIQGVAPRCNHCGCTIIGHGVEADTSIYCCAQCSRREGRRGLSDRADSKVA